ncbi:lasso peptide biosynthesis B2 protein [Paenibacillus methanolicus]|uniref:Transglutaminase superfamily protein n=1 Tax=Paenibacillus methanolicus TaxID=582686 RepID=A0A5S5BTG3_9BACL|nr:lasso peptide biosynthesis B2 protein [Paenibacillus methanolicus]TYP70297.1 transglutaminase superfamily protein [Paenibacillus methanolicus]
MVKLIRLFFAMRPREQLLTLEAFVLLGWARIMKSKPFPQVAPKLGLHMEETSREHRKEDEPVIRSISRVIGKVSRHTPWESMCMVKAMAAMKMLERRKLESTLYMGTSRDKEGKLIAHAWLRTGPYVITGAEEAPAFTVVSKFAKVLVQDQAQPSRSLAKE